MNIRRISQLYQRVSRHIENARQHIQRTIDIDMVKAYWCIGREIVEEEQFGRDRAEYGKAVLKELSNKLQTRYKRGFSVDTLEQARKFYIIYQEDEKSDALRRKSKDTLNFDSKLSWTHYRALIRIKRTEARKFYEIEASKLRIFY